MPTDNITKAVKRGTGEIEGVSYEEVIYEGTGPGGTLFLVDVLTDNRNRTVAEIRKIFEKDDGVLGAAGTAAWAFDRKGHIQLAKKAATEEQLMDVALGAGAEDITDEGEEWLVTTPADEVDVVRKALEAAKIEVKSAAARDDPRRTSFPSPAATPTQVIRLVETLDDHDDVQNVWSNFDISDEEIARLSGG